MQRAHPHPPCGQWGLPQSWDGRVPVSSPPLRPCRRPQSPLLGQVLCGGCLALSLLGRTGWWDPACPAPHPVLGGKSTVLSPSLLSFQIDSWCKDNSYVIAGYYQANERVKDARYGNGQALGVGAQDPSLLGVLCEPLQAPDAQCGCTLLPTFCACL